MGHWVCCHFDAFARFYLTRLGLPSVSPRSPLVQSLYCHLSLLSFTCQSTGNSDDSHSPFSVVQLAVQEVLYGLSLMAGGTALASNPATPTISAAVAKLLSFPRQPGAGSAASPGVQQAQQALRDVQLESSEVQQAIADLAAAAASAAAAAAASSGSVDASDQRGQQREEVARMVSRLRLLRVALHDAVRAMAEARAGAPAGAPSQLRVEDGLLRLHAIFSGERDFVLAKWQISWVPADGQSA